MKYLKPTIRSQKAFDVKTGGISLFGQCYCNSQGSQGATSSHGSSACNAHYSDAKSTTS